MLSCHSSLHSQLSCDFALTYHSSCAFAAFLIGHLKLYVTCAILSKTGYWGPAKPRGESKRIPRYTFPGNVQHKQHRAYLRTWPVATSPSSCLSFGIVFFLRRFTEAEVRFPSAGSPTWVVTSKASTAWQPGQRTRTPNRKRRKTPQDVASLFQSEQHQRELNGPQNGRKKREDFTQ